MGLVAPQPIQACVDDDAVQPAADRRVVAERGRLAVGRQHGVLQGIGGVVGVVAGHLGQPVELPVVAVEQLLEGVPITGDMCGEQLCVRSVDPPRKLPTAEH